MKPTVIIFLLLLYFSSASGMVINVHYCGKQVAKISVLNFTADKGCDCNPSNTAMDCCRNYKFYNKADNHKIIQLTSVAEIPALPVSTLLIPELLVSIPGAHSLATTAPGYLRSCSLPVYLLNRVFRI
jgi:hypothetical protein